MTPRELELVQFVAGGLKNREIAAAMDTTEHVIKNRLRSVFDKTGMSSRIEVALWYVAHEGDYVEQTKKPVESVAVQGTGSDHLSRRRLR